MIHVPASGPRRSALELGVILLSGLLIGLIYIFLIPPWQHYDEPTQFEYAWLVANRNEWPQPGDYDQRMRREVAASMIEHNFFRGMDYRPNLLSISEPIWIGIPQLGDQPFYYWYAALPLKLFRYTDITFQLYLARLASLALYLLTLVATWGIMRELTPPQHAYMRWLVPVTLAVIPGFVDLMTAVNNDVGATWAFTWFLWGGVRILKRGIRLLEIAWVGGAATLCYLTKSTVFVALPLLGLILFFSILKGRWRPYAWVSLLLLAIFGAWAFFIWGNALYWTPTTPLYTTTRIKSADAIYGQYALYLVASPKNPNPRLQQLLPTEQTRNLSGQTVTLGAWVWADRSAKAWLGILGPDIGEVRQEFEVKKFPQFVAFQISLPENQKRLWVELRAASPDPTQTRLVYFDGVVLAPGTYNLNTPPEFDSHQAKAGTWEGIVFQNVIRNASIETGWLEIRPWLYRRLETIPVDFAILISSIFDLPAAGWYYISSVNLMHQTFWARFGWGHVTVIKEQVVYPALGFFTLLGIAGALLLAFRRWKSLSLEVAVLLGVATLVIWTQAGLRGISSLFGQVLIPAARYAAPAASPTVLFLASGWVELGHWFVRITKIKPVYVFMGYFGLLIGLNGLAIYSLVQYYYR